MGEAAHLRHDNHRAKSENSQRAAFTPLHRPDFQTRVPIRARFGNRFSKRINAARRCGIMRRRPLMGLPGGRHQFLDG